MHNASLHATRSVCGLEGVRVRKSPPCVLKSCTLQGKKKKRRETIICYAGLTLKQGINAKL